MEIIGVGVHAFFLLFLLYCMLTPEEPCYSSSNRVRVRCITVRGPVMRSVMCTARTVRLLCLAFTLGCRVVITVRAAVQVRPLFCFSSGCRVRFVWDPATHYFANGFLLRALLVQLKVCPSRRIKKKRCCLPLPLPHAALPPPPRSLRCCSRACCTIM